MIKTLIEIIRDKYRTLRYGVRENQLELVLLPASQDQIEIVVPKGFYLRTYKKTDEKGLLEMVRLSGLAQWNESEFETIASNFLPNGFFVVVESGSEKIVAAMGARHTPNKLHPNAGDIGWLCSHPSYSGKGLGYVAAAAATNRLLEIGYSNIYVNTDDYRLPAIKIFLRLGYQPLMYNSNIENRWRIIFENFKEPLDT